MKLRVYMFGVAKEIFANRIVEVDIDNNDRLSVAALKTLLENQKPALGAIGNYMVASNRDFATDTDILNDKDEVAIIPPVSGG